MSTHRVRRSVLFVPAVRPDRLTKAVATGADAVCLDLEDGVSFEQKDDAREKAIVLLADPPSGSTEIMLRINEPGSELGERDLSAMLDAGVRPDSLMVPKVNGPDTLRALERRLGPPCEGLPLIVQIETAAGLAAIESIAMATPNVAVMFFGAVDLSAELGCSITWDALLYARSRVIAAAALVGVDAMDTPFMDVSDPKQLASEVAAVRLLGFTGKAAIHPSQVSIIQGGFSPDDEMVAWARRIVEAYETNKGGVLLVEGKLVERPVIASAQRVLAVATAVDRVGR
ncbi:MAG TPA: CoA ester lyase [Acidobacteria bacterium]|jgi:citrate lyase beta subunit|uniref:HpcH/HpaI aldolase/citrate lyase domain-containing protein n=1 Tax=marine metagenome TaxID=408172 RepID=A0A381QMF9_9ZZZZ|nr:CoA ester lyase [Acidobacteriota bacterium]